MKVLYTFFLHLLALFFLPKFLTKKNKYQKIIRFRLGKEFPEIEKESRPLIWVHAVSLGETKTVIPLIKKIRNHPTRPKILLTTATQTGFDEGKRNESEIDYHAFLPLDFPYIIDPIVKRVKPSLLILCETDFWFNFQKALKKVGAKIVLVNGKLSESSFKNFSRFKGFSRELFQMVDLFCVQGELYKKRFLKLGINEKKIKVTGNLKLDGVKESGDKESFRKELGISKEDLVLTLGSTHEPEEEMLLKALKPLWKEFPNLKVLIVPRHPERFEKVFELIKKENILHAKYSDGQISNEKRLTLIDAMGVLLKCYQISDLAFVAGSLTPRVGGHNILEPNFYGVAALYGPYMHTQPDLLDLSQSYNAGYQTGEENLTQIFKEFLQSKEKRKIFGENGLKLIYESRGALDKTYLEIQPLLEKIL